jgi:hypothetical protein
MIDESTGNLPEPTGKLSWEAPLLQRLSVDATMSGTNVDVERSLGGFIFYRPS